MLPRRTARLADWQRSDAFVMVRDRLVSCIGCRQCKWVVMPGLVKSNPAWFVTLAAFCRSMVLTRLAFPGPFG